MSPTPSLVKNFYEMLMKSQHWPAASLLEYQRSQLSQLLRHARKNVPFYRTRLDPVFKEDGEIDWDRWHEIPIVTRTDLRDRRIEMLAAKLPPGHGPTKTFTTSGSSGIPVSVEATRLGGYANRAAARRFHKLQGIETKPSATIDAVTDNGEPFSEEYLF